MQLLGVPDPLDEHVQEIRAAAQAACDRAHARGYQAGLRDKGEPWVALFFGAVGGLVGAAITYLSLHGR